MTNRSKFSIQSLILIVILNAIILTALYLYITPFFQQLHQLLEPLLANSESTTVEQMRQGFSNIYNLLVQKEERFIFVVFGVGGLITIFLWFGVTAAARKLIPSRSQVAAREKTTIPEMKKTAEVDQASSASAVQLLSILQRGGRLIDFLEEDLSAYQDEQIGAAVRSIHEGCKKALKEYVRIEPIFEQPEGSQVTVQTGFDANEIRLTGNVTGEPPFTGAVRHRGWRVIKVDLPKQMDREGKKMILTPAEVEVG
ncbi:MAG: DUF2760 domain-containing protein [Calditrichia bacterium]